MNPPVDIDRSELGSIAFNKELLLQNVAIALNETSYLSTMFTVWGNVKQCKQVMKCSRRDVQVTHKCRWIIATDQYSFRTVPLLGVLYTKWQRGNAG